MKSINFQLLEKELFEEFIRMQTCLEEQSDEFLINTFLPMAELWEDYELIERIKTELENRDDDYEMV